MGGLRGGWGGTKRRCDAGDEIAACTDVAALLMTDGD
jgi:hypothetical protein